MGQRNLVANRGARRDRGNRTKTRAARTSNSALRAVMREPRVQRRREAARVVTGRGSETAAIQPSAAQ